MTSEDLGNKSTNDAAWKDIFSINKVQKRLLVKKVHYHMGIKYPFTWSKHNHYKFQQKNLKCSRELWRYLNRVSKSDFPTDWFNDYSVTRISSFRLKKLKRGIVPKIGKQLIRDGIIKEIELNDHFLKMVRKIYSNFFRDYSKSKNPSHDYMMGELLKKDEYSIATEIPVWNDMPEKVTGHIDLLRIIGDELLVVDYKPEGNFMRSIPQIAYYGLVLKELLKIDTIKCVSFNNKKVWEYNPEDVLNNTTRILSEIDAEPFTWQYFFIDIIN